MDEKKDMGVSNTVGDDSEKLLAESKDVTLDSLSDDSVDTIYNLIFN